MTHDRAVTRTTSSGVRIGRAGGLVAIAALLLGACAPAPPSAPAAAGAKPTTAPAPPAATTAPAAAAPTAAPAAKPTEAAKPAAPAQPAGERVVKHAMGETKVAASPQRVVTLDTGELDSAITLGIKPVGAVTVLGGEFPEYLKGKTDGIRVVGAIGQPNLEAIAALRPDLILGSKLRDEKVYDKLAQIAPTVFTETVGVVWKENFVKHAEALGKAAEGEKIMADYQKRTADFKTRMGDRLKTTQVSVIRSLPDQVRIMMKASYIGTILDDLGLPRPPAQNKDVFMEQGSKERIPDMDGDVIFVTYFTPDRGAQLKTLIADPLWSQLKAVKAGKIYEVPDEYWMVAIGITGANRVLDDLFKYLAA